MDRNIFCWKAIFFHIHFYPNGKLYSTFFETCWPFVDQNIFCWKESFFHIHFYPNWKRKGTFLFKIWTKNGHKNVAKIPGPNWGSIRLFYILNPSKEDIALKFLGKCFVAFLKSKFLLRVLKKVTKKGFSKSKCANMNARINLWLVTTL